MRITNQMMINSSMANIQVNKNQLSTLDTQLSTQKRINKPSEDPIIAIRALRLRASLDQVNLYLDKNIPDADSWLKVTEDALEEGYDIVSDLYRYCTQGATDSYSSAERNTIAESLNKLRDAFYSQGDVDYAGRYVFTGFATDKPLTYQSDADAANVDYTITQKFTRADLSNKTVYTNAYSNKDIMDLNVHAVTPNIATVHRLQLAYSEVAPDSFTIKDSAGNQATITNNNGTIALASAVDASGNNVTAGMTVTPTTPPAAPGITGSFLSTGSGNPVTVSFTSDNNYIPGADEVAINAATGEVLLGENVYQDVYKNDAFSVTYDKDNFKKGDINPTMYFDCVDNNTGIEYTKQQEDIEYNINFSQKLKVNTEAVDGFNIYLGRNLDDLIASVQNVLDVEAQIEQVEAMMKEEQYSSPQNQKKLSDIMEGLNKQKDFAEDQMTKAFEAGEGQMQRYQEQISNAKADVGNRETRLNLTKGRLTEQKTNFTNLKSQNEDIDIEEVVVTYTAANLVYNASLSAASKVVQQTLLDFLG